MIACYKKNQNTIHSLFQDNNYFDISSIYQIDQNFTSDGVSIKCVLDGIEHYTIGGKMQSIQSNKYLLTNYTSDCKIEIDSPQSVKGICVNLSQELIADVAATMIMPDTQEVDLDLGYYFNSNLFLDGEYDLNSNLLGNFLTKKQNIFHNIDLIDDNYCSELFYQLTESLILDQLPLFTSLQKIKSIKINTKKDLFYRVLRGKIYMENHFLDSIYIKDIAREACMSEYHFFRLFKEVMGVTPYHYILKLKLEFCYKKLKKERLLISDLADLSGFADISAFSKAFKKHFGINPSQIKYL